ncbi:hypothetical protein PMAYCL1PPCAC_17039, partial [Pristionchus mayeri]
SFRPNKDGSLPLITGHWANFPADVILKFYAWNITNPDEALLKIAGGSFLGTKIPEQPKAAGILPFYNYSYEPEFRIRTGLGNIENVTKIVSYGGERSTHWNIGEEIQNCNEGAMNKQFLTAEDNLHVFVSYAGRAFEMDFFEKSSLETVPTFMYRVNREVFNTNGKKNIAMRYENEQGIDYFPSWQPCPAHHIFNPNGTSCAFVDCSQEVNFCNSCCNGSHFEGTVFTPPGFYQLKVLPGRMDDAPIPVFISPPHMLWAPDEVSSIYTGQIPNEDLHQPIEWTVNPMLGAALHGHARVQMNVPVWKGALTQSSNLPNSMAPLGWLDLEVKMHKDMMILAKLAGLYVPYLLNFLLFFPLLYVVVSVPVTFRDKIVR